MLRLAFLSLVLLVSLSSTTLLRKSISRRQSDGQHCQAIEGFDCQCSPYRVTCTSDRDIPQSLNVLPNEQHKYPSVELIINGARDQHIYEYTLEPVKQLFKPDSDHMEFRIKFDKFTALHLSQPGIFNRVFPENAPATARKHLAVEIVNQQVQADDNVNLFSNLNVDGLELYSLYPFRGTFQQLFNGANIKYLRVSGADIRSDLSQPFTGNVGRLELAKQANQLTTQNFPVYPAHELIIDAFYVADFNSDNPPNYSNLAELRIYTQQSIPANAFRHFPNLRTLSVATDKDIDPHAFDGLHNLEKLTIKDAKPSLQILNNLPNLKEFESNIEKLDGNEQCQLIEKLANGQVAIQATPSGRECTCASAYLEAASGRYPCDAQNCDQSTCAAIKNNYDATARTFKAPPAIKRADGSDALRPRDPKVYSGPFQITRQDQDKVQSSSQQGGSQQGNEQEGDGQQQSEGVTQPGQTKKSRRTKPRTQTTTPGYDQQQNVGDQGQGQGDQRTPPYLDSHQGEGGEQGAAGDGGDNRQDGDGNENRQDGDGNENRQDGEGSGNRQSGDGTENRREGDTGNEHHSQSDSNQVTDALSGDMAGVAPPPKKGLGWIPIIIIIAAVAGLLLLGLIILLMRRRRAAAGGYNAAATSEHGTARA